MAKAENLRQRIPVQTSAQSPSLIKPNVLDSLMTPRLCLGSVTTTNYPDIASLNANPAVQRFLCLSKAPPTYEEALTDLPCFLSIPAPPGGGIWCIRNRSTTDFLGLILLLYTENYSKIELGYRLLPKIWNHCYVTEAGCAVVNYAFTNLGLTELCAIIHPDNTASKTVAEKLGFLRIDCTTRLGFNLDHYTLMRDSLISSDSQKAATN